MKKDSLWVWKFSSCEKKKAYPDEQTAKSMAGRQSKISGHNIKAYQCHFGAHWHIGHTSWETRPGPKLYCWKCDKKIPLDRYDKHTKELHS